MGLEVAVVADAGLLRALPLLLSPLPLLLPRCCCLCLVS